MGIVVTDHKIYVTKIVINNAQKSCLLKHESLAKRVTHCVR